MSRPGKASGNFSQLWDCVRGERTPAERRSLAVLFAIASHASDSGVPQTESAQAIESEQCFVDIMLDTAITDEVTRTGFTIRRLPQPLMWSGPISFEDSNDDGQKCMFRKPGDGTMLKVNVEDAVLDDVATMAEVHAHLKLGSLPGTAGSAFTGVAQDARSGQKVCSRITDVRNKAPTLPPLLNLINGNGLADINASDPDFQKPRMMLCDSDFGSPFAACSPRAKLFSLQLLRFGAPRLCIVVAPGSRTRFIACVKAGSNASFMCSQAVEHQGAWPTIAWLEENKIEYLVSWQEANELLIVSPGSFVYGINTGSYVMETLHYAKSGWNAGLVDSDDYQFCRGSCEKSVGYFNRNSYHSFAAQTSAADETLEREAAKLSAARRGIEGSATSKGAGVYAVQGPASVPSLFSAPPSSSSRPTATTPVSLQSTTPCLESTTPPFTRLNRNRSLPLRRDRINPPVQGSSRKRKQSPLHSPPMSPDAFDPSESGTTQASTRLHTPAIDHEQGTRFRKEIEAELGHAGMVGPPGLVRPADVQLSPSKKRRVEQAHGKEGSMDFVERVMSDIEADLGSLEEVVSRYTQDTIDAGFGSKWDMTLRLETATKFESRTDISRMMAYYQYACLRGPFPVLDRKGVCVLPQEVLERVPKKSEEACFWATLVEHCSTGILVLIRQSYKRPLSRVGKTTVFATLQAIQGKFYDVRARGLEPLSAAILGRKPREEVLRLLAEWKERQSGGLLDPHQLKSQLIEFC